MGGILNLCLLSEDPVAAHGGQDDRHKLGTSELKAQGPLSALTSFPYEGLYNWANLMPGEYVIPW